MLKRCFGVAALVGATLAPGFAQDTKQDLTIQATGNFTKETTTSAGRHRAEQTAGFLLSYNRFFKGNNGLQLNYGVLRNRQEFASSTPTPGGPFGANSKVNLHEFSAAYVYRWDRGSYRPFVLGGAGILTFDQVNAGNSPSKLMVLYGAGVDFDITEKLYFRGMVRGQVYRIPGLGHLFPPYVQGFTHVLQPTVGAGFRF